MTAKQKRLVAALAVVALIAASWLVLISPALEDRNAARDELGQAQATEDTAVQSLQTAQDAERRVPQNRRALRELSRAVPAQAESAALLDRLDALARRSGVRFDSLQLAGAADTTGAPAATGTSDGAAASAAPAGAQEVPVTLTVRGSYPRVVRLLRQLNGRGATLGGERLLRLDAVAVGQEDAEGGGGASGRLSVDITAVAFVLPQPGADAADASGASAPPSPGDAAASAPAAGGTE